jgi:hypothetical protein
MRSLAEWRRRVAGALSAIALVEESGAARWSALLPARGGETIAATVLEDSWLLVDAPLDPGACTWRELAGEAAAFPGLGKPALVGAALRYRAEIPLDEETAVDARLAEALAGLGASVPVSAEAPEADLAALCAAAGRDSRESGAGRAIDLAAEVGHPCTAIVEQDAGRVRLSAEWITREVPDAVSREAIALLMLRANAAIRLVRGSARDEGDRLAARLEVRFGATPTPAEVGHALNALAAGGRRLAREIRVLEGAEVATRYLALATSPNSQNHKENENGNRSA